MIGFRFKTFGDAEKIMVKFERTGVALADMRPVMERIFRDMLKSEEGLFLKQGRKHSRAWKPLAPSTLERKGSDRIMFTGGSKAGYGSGQDLLFKSLTRYGAKYQKRQITRSSAGLGTTRPGAAAHQYGWPEGNIPRRPIIVFGKADSLKWRYWIQEYLMDATKGISGLHALGGGRQ